MGTDIKTCMTIALTFLSFNVQAADLILCEVHGRTSRDYSMMRVSESPTGYSFNVYDIQNGERYPFVKSGTINRDMVEKQEAPAMTFSNERVSIFHMFGEYVFFDQETRKTLTFKDKNCVVNDDV